MTEKVIPSQRAERERLCFIIEELCPHRDPFTAFPIGSQVERLADAVLAALSPDDIRREERERCAVVCDDLYNTCTWSDTEALAFRDAAAAIRSQPSREGEK